MSTLTTLIQEARASVRSLTPDQFAATADRPHTLVVDVRESGERVASGSIARAIHVPRGVLEFCADPDRVGHDPRLHPSACVLLYCADGARSALAARSLELLGYTDVAHLQGGLVAWERAQLPLVGRQRAPY